MMQSIINTSGFGFCKASSFRNCNNCIYKLRCIKYAPIYLSNYNQSYSREVYKNENTRLLESNPDIDNKVSMLTEENLVLKQKIQELEGQILQAKKINIEETETNKQVVQEENNLAELQVYENKNLEVYQQDSSTLKAKRGIFGTKYVEDKPKKK